MSSTKKSVLVSYLNRNKVVEIPVTHEGSEVEYLKKVFVTMFAIEGILHNEVVLQKYDEYWEEFIDLEDDCTLSHKDKLKAVLPVRVETNVYII